jgi:hypothetical protein
VTYIQTDDPADPCTYDVQWMTPEGRNVETMEDADRALPFIGPDKVALTASPRDVIEALGYKWDEAAAWRADR